MEHRRREPAPGIFRLVLPLPFPGLRRVNAYLLADDRGVSLVDCGINEPAPDRDHGWEDVRAAFEAAGFAIEQVARLIVTHTHIDHYGMAGRFVSETGCDLWMHDTASAELEIYKDPHKATRALASMLAEHGVDEEDIDELTAFEDWRPFVSGIVEATKSVSGGETFACGDRQWHVVYTPGHARSHICLHSPDDGILISGDHLLPSITPHIDFRRDADHDPLGEFLASLDVVEELDPPLVLPGHGHPFEDGGARARVVARHHDRRLGSILQVIRREARTASEISDEIFGTTLLNFERRLALGEALAHLAYLRERGEIERIKGDDGHFRYRKLQRGRVEEDE
jgi:glyoxylase-like metal-dependent hydrolase (beta-lactamase superfamily II)